MVWGVFCKFEVSFSIDVCFITWFSFVYNLRLRSLNFFVVRPLGTHDLTDKNLVLSTYYDVTRNQHQYGETQFKVNTAYVMTKQLLFIQTGKRKLIITTLLKRQLRKSHRSDWFQMFLQFDKCIFVKWYMSSMTNNQTLSTIKTRSWSNAKLRGNATLLSIALVSED